MALFLSLVIPVWLTAAANSSKLKMKTFKSHDGTTIAYDVQGQGVPVLLIHGYFATGDANWGLNNIVQTLAKTNQVITLDNRGHGASQKYHVSSKYGANMYKDALALLDHLNIEKAHVHGYSMGGSMVTQMLYHAPERFITAIYGGAGVPEFDKNHRAQIPAEPKGDDPQEKEARDMLMNTLRHDYLAMNAVRMNAPWSGPEHNLIDLNNVNIPVLSIVGEFDGPNAKTHRMERELKNYRKVVLKGKAHLTAVTAQYMPKLYLDELTAFIARNDSSSWW